MPATTPLARMKEGFGDKSKLVEAVEKLTGDGLWVARTNEKKGLAYVSNAKLLRLHSTFTEVKEKFGSREKLVEAILELENRTQDPGLKQKLSTWPVPRLFDAYLSAAKRNARKARQQQAGGSVESASKAASGTGQTKPAAVRASARESRTSHPTRPRVEKPGR